MENNHTINAEELEKKRNREILAMLLGPGPDLIFMTDEGGFNAARTICNIFDGLLAGKPEEKDQK